MVGELANQYVAIMAGGIGSRFWPVSRAQKPKQFLDILGTGESLLQATFRRFRSFIQTDNIFVVTAEKYRSMVLEQLPQLSADNLLCEPMRKNTAPCIAYLSTILHEKNPNAQLICSPADHFIREEPVFVQTCQLALSFAHDHPNCFVTLGIRPHCPHTGYGYIECEDGGQAVCCAKNFVEKPNLGLAKTFIERGNFLWNAGLFIARNGFILDMFATHSPKLYSLFHANRARLLNDTPEQKVCLEEVYSSCLFNSFDHEIMEKASSIYVIPANFGWSDLGSWNSLDGLVTNNERIDENVSSLKYLQTYGSKHNVVYSDNPKKLILLDSLQDYIVIDTQDVLLVCPRNSEQETKRFANDLLVKKWEKYL